MRKKRTHTKTQVALDYLDQNPRATPYAAARAAGVAPSVVYRAIALRQRPLCPCCGRAMRA